MEEILFTVTPSNLVALFLGFLVGWFGVFCLGRW